MNERRCSKSCGRGCTKAEYDLAKKSAAALAKRLGPKWTPDVWENLGWHWCAVSPCGRFKVHPSFGAGFIAFLGRASESGGIWTAHAKTPHAAVLAVLREAQEALKPYSNLLDTSSAIVELVKP